MPYRRKYKRRRKKAGKGTRALAKRAFSLAKNIASSKEVKYHDIKIDTEVDWSAAGPLDLANIAPGLADTSRIGDQIRVTSINFKWIAYRQTSAATYIRVIVIRDHQDAILDIGSVLQEVDTPSGFQSHYVHDVRPQYSVIFDKYFKLSDDYSNSSAQRWYKKLNFKIQYVAGSTSVISKNQIKAFAISDVSSQASAKPQLYGYMRLNYLDS